MDSIVFGCNTNTENWRFSSRFFAAIVLLASGCLSGPPTVPYPAFIVVDELPDAFVAGLPGVRAKQLTGDEHTRRSGARIEIPPDWAFSSGASPGLSVEIFVLRGAIDVGEYPLTVGGYAYIPPGSTGLPLRSDNGATILYFLDNANEKSVIRTPLITNSSLVDWESPVFNLTGEGLSIKELRADPGSGARTWLLQLEPGSVQHWQYSSQAVEGYLLSGAVVGSECVAGKAATSEYLPGGYFHRPPGAIHGGPAATTLVGATWLMRVTASEQIEVVAGCEKPPE
jgi:quercetin dioxygenase-like cupin family protein